MGKVYKATIIPKCSVCGKHIKGPQICVSMKDYEIKCPECLDLDYPEEREGSNGRV